MPTVSVSRVPNSRGERLRPRRVWKATAPPGKATPTEEHLKDTSDAGDQEKTEKVRAPWEETPVYPWRQSAPSCRCRPWPKMLDRYAPIELVTFPGWAFAASRDARVAETADGRRKNLVVESVDDAPPQERVSGRNAKQATHVPVPQEVLENFSQATLCSKPASRISMCKHPRT